MSSSDDEARQSSLGASSSKHAVPVLDSKDSHDEDELPQNKQMWEMNTVIGEL